MVMTFDKKSYDIKYHKDKLKRVPLDMPIEKYQEVKSAADNAGESVNGYIKKAVDMRMDSESSADN